eukprot:TRINITY_DN6722_c1_g4_i1.p1 TRINITY_DN6722_c1_g4~~TRINITY_DN6722_c1_g4_i1.p1  ORF type:complete len:794 (+),score=437.93 TRINITY_DN6722_c1_g4_i1:263-2644(+)
MTMAKQALRCVVLSVLVSVVSSQVVAIDLGSDFIKVAGVKPGAGIDVVLNEQSKRKSNNYIGYRGDDRYLGEDAFNLAPRFPDQMYTFINRLAGKSYSDSAFREETFIKGWGLPYKFSEDETRKTIRINHPDPKTQYSPEELLSQIISYVRTQSEKHMEINVTAAVMTVPSFFTVAEREALVQAANLSGLPVLSLVPNTLAAALQYGVQRRGFGNQTANVVIYDMGASRTEVGVFRFTAPLEVNGKPKRGGELGNVETLATAFDDSLGGRTFTDAIADYLMKKFEEKEGVSFEGKTDKASLKAHTVLLRRANKAKEVLSANKQAPVNIEELYQGKPFFYNLKREEFEKIAADLFKRAAPLLVKALEDADLKPDDLHAVEVVGGGIRIPALQNSLSEALGGRTLDKTLNGDECMVLGAAFEGAKLSETFRTRGFIVHDRLPYNVSFQLSQLEGSDKTPKMRPLFVNSNPGSKKSITVSRTSDFDLKLFLDREGQAPELLKTYSLKEIPSALDSVGFNKEGKNASNTHSVQVQVKLTNEGLVQVESAMVKYDDHVTVQKKIKIKEPKPEKEEKKDEEKKDEEKKDGEEKDEKAPEEPKYKFVNKTEVKKHRKHLQYTVETVAPHPMGESDYNHSVEVLGKLQAIEDVKRAAAAAKNELEAYLYWAKFEGILDNDDMAPFITEEEREEITKVLEDATEWAEYGEGSVEGTKKETFQEKKADLVKVISKVTDKKKAKEDEERAAALQAKKEKLAAEAAKKAAKKAEKEEVVEDETASKDGEEEKPAGDSKAKEGSEL